MSLEEKSKELKTIVAKYDTQWFLGDLCGQMKSIGESGGDDELGRLSSPMRQLYYLAGLNITSDPDEAVNMQFSHNEWNKIVDLLNEIEFEYDKLFFPKTSEEVNEQWTHIRKVAMPSFLAYFNQGPLNYEEQRIEWVERLFNQFDKIIEAGISLKTSDFILFYQTLDQLMQKNLNSFMFPRAPVKEGWRGYTKIKGKNTAPAWLGFTMSEKEEALFHFMSDRGIMNRFYPDELVSENLPEEKVQAILSLISCYRLQSDYLYYTSTKPGNPVLEKPIVNLRNRMYQVFEVKQVIHAFENMLENLSCSNPASTKKYIDKKGKLLETKIIELFKEFFGNDCRIIPEYYVDGCEQDILILWKKYAFIIEGKGYSIREPFRNPDQAFVRIKDDFERSIGYGYTQTRRVEKKFIDGVPLRIEDKNGNLNEEIDTTQYEQDFSIIVNLESFGPIQNDLSILLKLENEDDVYPWVVKLDDLEVFLLTMKAQRKTPADLVNFLLMREKLHGKLMCMDESEVCGGFLEGKLTDAKVDKVDMIVTSPDWANIFDKQYFKGMGFKNEKNLKEKTDGRHIFF